MFVTISIINEAYQSTAIIVIDRFMEYSYMVFSHLQFGEIKIEKTILMLKLLNFLLVDEEASNFLSLAIKSQFLRYLLNPELNFGEPFVGITSMQPQMESIGDGLQFDKARSVLWSHLG